MIWVENLFSDYWITIQCIGATKNAATEASKIRSLHQAGNRLPKNTDFYTKWILTSECITEKAILAIVKHTQQRNSPDNYPLYVSGDFKCNWTDSYQKQQLFSC